ncbi:hypothetical protein LOTGIDRAFT_155989 [Lottia gigantea]|uniref:Uncharacterized protein n=1 Tax=Lottia gigantea TaxID=225164 RepID=V4B376_LOTGI|nr:hypothetical protein LOTGIDRAFT_155989 [Lottia gigantea]ESP04768.1 hypothetical protein LOTGIDRAFT_155989 [Lottia gigantea]
MESLKDKVVLITGASSGIGRGTAVHFAKLGSKLSLHGRDGATLEETATLCIEAGAGKENILTELGDVRDESIREKIINKTIEKFGRLDVLVNNAGVLCWLPALQTPKDNFDIVMDTNLKAPFALTKLAAPHLIKSKGSIVNVSSLGGARSFPLIGVYCMSKAALDMFTECICLELAPQGVRVNSVNPGVVISQIHQRATDSPYKSDEAFAQFITEQNNLHPLGRVGEPEDVAQAIAFLASDQSSFISGQTLFLDGGRHCL